MRLVTVLVALSFAVLSALPAPAMTGLSVTIRSPGTGDKVDQRHDVTGSVSDSTATVWVVVRPVETSDFWVQPPVTIRHDGTWRVRAYFGEAGKHVGKEYEVRAFANPTESVAEGRRSDWPKATAQSDVVDVTRR